MVDNTRVRLATGARIWSPCIFSTPFKLNTFTVTFIALLRSMQRILLSTHSLEDLLFQHQQSPMGVESLESYWL